MAHKVSKIIETNNVPVGNDPNGNISYHAQDALNTEVTK